MAKVTSPGVAGQHGLVVGQRLHQQVEDPAHRHLVCRCNDAAPQIVSYDCDGQVDEKETRGVSQHSKDSNGRTTQRQHGFVFETGAGARSRSETQTTQNHSGVHWTVGENLRAIGGCLAGRTRQLYLPATPKPTKCPQIPTSCQMDSSAPDMPSNFPNPEGCNGYSNPLVSDARLKGQAARE